MWQLVEQVKETNKTLKRLCDDGHLACEITQGLNDHNAVDYTDVLYDIRAAIEKLEPAPPALPVLDLQAIFVEVGRALRYNKKHADEIRICFFLDPTLEGEEIKSLCCKSGDEVRVFLPKTIYQLTCDLSNEVLNAWMSDYKDKAPELVDYDTCFYNPRKNGHVVTVSYWSEQWQQCLLKHVHDDERSCEGVFEALCKCRMRVCTGHMDLIPIQSKCSVCGETYKILGPKLKKRK